MERYAETNGKTSETGTRDKPHATGYFFSEEAALRNKRVIQGERAEILRRKNSAGGAGSKTYAQEFGADSKAGRIF